MTKQFMSVTRLPVPAPARMAAREKREVLDRIAEAPRPALAVVVLGLGERAGDTVERRIDRRLVLEPVTRPPDVLGERVRERGHRSPARVSRQVSVGAP